MKNEKLRVPKLRFKEFSGEWNILSIQELIERNFIISHLDGNHGELYPKSSEFSDKGIPYISANDLVNNRVDLNNCKYLPFEIAKRYKKGIAKDGDVIFAHNATVGPTALLKTNLDFVILSTTTTYFRCNINKLSNIYFLIYLTSINFIKQYSRVMSQSTRNQVPITMQRKFFVSLPTKKEQEKIASFLSSIDKKINQLSKKDELLQNYKKAMMQKIFSQKLRFKKEDGSEYPKWEEKKLGDISNIIMGQSPDSKSYNNDGDGIYLIQGNADIEDRKSNPRSWTNEPTKECKVGDLILTVRAPVGAIAKSLHNACIGRGVCVIRNKETSSLEYLYQYLLWFEPRWIALEQGSTFTAVSSSDIKSLKIPFPYLKEQIKIANFLSSLDTKISQNKKALEETQKFKKALLQKMFV